MHPSLHLLVIGALLVPAGAEAPLPRRSCRAYELQVVGEEALRPMAAQLATAALGLRPGRSVRLAPEGPTGAGAEQPSNEGCKLRLEVEGRGARYAARLEGEVAAGRREVLEAEAPSLVSAVEEVLAAGGLAPLPGVPLVSLVPPPACDPARKPVVHALLVGIDDYAAGRATGVQQHLMNLEGSKEDVELLGQALRARYPGAAIRALVDGDATGVGLRRALTELVLGTRCGDMAFFHYSGHGVRPSERRLDPDDRFAMLAADAGLLGEGELRGYVTALRNRRALALVHLDAMPTSGLRLGTSWRWPPGQEAELLPGAGAYALLAAGAVAHEMRIQGRPAGQFSARTAAALGSGAIPTARALAKALSPDSEERPAYFEASDPDAPIAPAEPSAQRRVLGLRLEEEGAQRGLVKVAPAPSTREVTLRGQVTDEGLAALLVDGRQARVDAAGAFQIELALKEGRQQLAFVGIFKDLSTAGTSRELEVAGAGAGGGGRRLALVIGIQNYDKWSPLRTPLADARAVAAALREGFGFETSLETFGSLLLEDPDRITIGAALTALRHALRPQDSLLVYFAGHGYATGGKERRRGYWIPRDGDLENRTTWLSGSELRESLAEIQARHVLVVSDSCFAGDLTRGDPEGRSKDPAARRRVLEESALRTSRRLLASGSDEPVADGGGGGHSIFARALLDGLRTRSEDRFLASDLFHDHIAERVVGQSRQKPAYEVMPDSGHEGGELVFVRKVGPR